MAARSSSSLAAVGLCLAAALALVGCAASGRSTPAGSDAPADAQGAPGTQRGKWPVLPPPQWVKPGDDDTSPARTNKK